MNILIVEDQENPLWVLEQAVGKLGDGNTVDIAKWYTQAEQTIQDNKYDVILLDHRMPRKDPGCTDESDFEKFCEQLEDIGYGLTPLILEKSPATVIIGTSTLPDDHIKAGGHTAPIFTLAKATIIKELPALVATLRKTGCLPSS